LEVKKLQKYIVLGNWTNQGRKTIEDVPKRIEKSHKLIEEHNGSLSVCFTMGEYDFVAIVDMPDEESMAKVILKLNEMQNFKTNTLRAWPDDEFAKIVSKL
jgi:uncharacterized protein with GYD domain